uniref:Putative 28 kDa metastriate family member n=1 Tax=Rhipicephalus pulchellus TaxID=72859 RepID=L7MBN0_RHIPC
MDTLLVILLGCCCACFAEGDTRSGGSKARHGEWTKLEKELEDLRTNNPKYKDPRTVGEGVELRAEVMYNTAFYRGSAQWRNNHKSSAEEKETIMKDYFGALFEKLQIYFHKQSISVNITVASVAEMNNLMEFYVNETKLINAKKTLHNIQVFGSSREKRKNTIFYLFTWPESMGNPNRSLDLITAPGEHQLGVSAAATKGTFCSTTTSAALIRHHFRSGNFWSTAKASATVFGSEHFLAITGSDREEMAKTFSYVYARTFLWFMYE